MTTKKRYGRFTLQFDTSQPNQRQVIDFLEGLGRTKAKFIAEAVWHYFHCDQTKGVVGHLMLDDNIVIEETGNIKPSATKMQEEQKNIAYNSEQQFNDLDEADMVAIFDTISAFKNK